MEHKLALKLSKYFLDQKIISQENYDISVYGGELLISFIISTVLILLSGMLFNRLVQTVLFLTIFIFMRRYTGGYHAPSHFKCKLTTIATHLLVLGLSEWTTVGLTNYIIILVLGSIVILLIGPIENSNKPLSIFQKSQNKRISLVLYILIMIICTILHIHHSMYSSSILYSAMMVIVLMIIAQLQTRLENKGGVIGENNR